MRALESTNDAKRILLVEGKDDSNVVFHICQAQESPIPIPESFSIVIPKGDATEEDPTGGIDKVLKELKALIKKSNAGDGPEIIGIVVDADSDIAGQWKRIRDRISEFVYDFPSAPNIKGTILPDNPGNPRLGIWLMPNNQDPGMLEDFLIGLAKPGTITVARDSVETARLTGVAEFEEVHYSKAVAHTYLAWQKRPGIPLGLSVKTHAFRPDTDTARSFARWLHNLFVS